MAFDYKKEYKEFYLPPQKPTITDIPTMCYAAVRGQGNPNEPDGEYKAAMETLYGVSFTIKMSYKGSRQIDTLPMFEEIYMTAPALIMPAKKLFNGFP